MVAIALSSTIFFKSGRKPTNKPERALPFTCTNLLANLKKMEVVERSGLHFLAKCIEAFGRHSIGLQ
jgi:hypothetical protein